MREQTARATPSNAGWPRWSAKRRDGAAGEDAALLYDVVATAELDAARTPPSTESECDDDDAALLMALKAAPCAS